MDARASYISYPLRVMHVQVAPSLGDPKKGHPCFFWEFMGRQVMGHLPAS
jgi:hypothetical protein